MTLDQILYWITVKNFTRHWVMAVCFSLPLFLSVSTLSRSVIYTPFLWLNPPSGPWTPEQNRGEERGRPRWERNRQWSWSQSEEKKECWQRKRGTEFGITGKKLTEEVKEKDIAKARWMQEKWEKCFVGKHQKGFSTPLFFFNSFSALKGE